MDMIQIAISRAPYDLGVGTIVLPACLLLGGSIRALVSVDIWGKQWQVGSASRRCTIDDTSSTVHLVTRAVLPVK